MDLIRSVGDVSLATQSHYIIRRKFWSFFERVFRVFTSDGQLIMYIKHPILKLREEFVVYEDEAQTKPMLRVKSKQVIANCAADVAYLAFVSAEVGCHLTLASVSENVSDPHIVFVPLDEPAGTFTLTSPPGVRIGTVAPSAASQGATGAST